jgi:hypothetical protein
MLGALLGVAAASEAGCSDSNSVVTCPTCEGGSPLPEFITPYGSCDVMDGFAVATAKDCPGIPCASGTYYAICSGTQWVSCDCERPETGTLISDPNFAGAPCSGCDSGEDMGPGYDGMPIFEGGDAPNEVSTDVVSSKDVTTKDVVEPKDVSPKDVAPRDVAKPKDVSPGEVGSPTDARKD